MRQQTMFITVDGRQFDNPNRAKDHEERLFEAWLKAEGSHFRLFLGAVEPNDREITRGVLRAYFLWQAEQKK